MAGSFKDQGNRTVRVAPMARPADKASKDGPAAGSGSDGDIAGHRSRTRLRGRGKSTPQDGPSTAPDEAGKRDNQPPSKTDPDELGQQGRDGRTRQGTLWQQELSADATDRSSDNPVSGRPHKRAAEAPTKAAATTSTRKGGPHAGHRQRLRARFREGGADAMPDYELLEMVLFRALPRRDTKPLAKRLISRFGSFAEVINAPLELLMELDGVSLGVLDELKLIRASLLRVMHGEIMQRPALGSWDAVLNYCRAAMGFEPREQFRILFLDKRNRLIADEVQQQGTVDHTPVYVREVVKRALEHSATAIILVHNHPSGDPTPSRADIDMTKMIMVAAKNLGIDVHDHIIVGKEGHTSMKGLRLI